LTFNVATNTFGSATVAVTVDDGQSSNTSITRSFTITVNQLLSPPVLQITASSPGNLTISGNIGKSYRLEYSTNCAPGFIWHPLLDFTQTNASQTFGVGSSNPVIFYRAVQQP
jgi:hypothetical protein